MSIKDVFNFVVAIGVVCLGWLAIEAHIDKALINWSRTWIEPLDQLYAIVALYTTIGVGSIVYLYNHYNKKAHLSTNGWVAWITITLIYSYYRWDMFSPFVFWGYKGWKWLDVIYVLDGIFVIYEISYWIRLWKQEKANKKAEALLITDEAIDNADADIFGYDARAADLKTQLEAVGVSKHAFSVGISGDWGLGKSSFLNLFAKQLEKEGQIVIRFAPRSAKNIDLIQDRFFSEFSKGLSKYTYNARTTIGKYAYVLNLHSSTKWIFSIWKFFDDWTYESEKDNINAIIRSTGKRIYVIIEDLDRLTGEEILETLKVIDSNGNFCNTIFITAYDRNYVNDVLRAKLGYVNSKTYFTDKYFQYEMQLFKQEPTPLYDFMTKNLYDWAMAEWGNDPYVRKTEIDSWIYLYLTINKYITTVREAKRYINLFRTIYKKSRQHVDFEDFAIVILIRFLDMKTYYDLYERVYVSNASDVSPNNFTYKLVTKYKELAEKSSIKDLASLLEFLFGGPEGTRRYDSLYNRIYKAEYFDNYFYQTLKGRLYYDDLNQLMEAKTLDEAFAKIEVILQNAFPDKEERSIVEFLSTREPIWLQTPERLKRYICLLLYANNRIPHIYLLSSLNRMMQEKMADDFSEWMSKDEYKGYVISAINMMQDYVPHAVGVYMRDRLKERMPDFDTHNEYLETIQEGKDIMYISQVRYDNMYSKISNWRAEWSMDLAELVNVDEKEDRERKREQLNGMMYAHPDDYAKAMLVFGEADAKSHLLVIALQKHNIVANTLGGEEAFEEWLNVIKEEDLHYIVNELHQISKEGRRPQISINMQVENPKDNLPQVATILKNMRRRGIR